jgi:dTDP-4-amino-4,6-dideoxygalactose transaminase
MNVPLLDLKAQYAAIKAGIDLAVQEVFQSQYFILGPKVAECEAAIAKYSNCAFAVGVSSGTDALLASLMAEEIGPGREVITTPFTFFATAGSIARLGAKPVFVDIDPATYNLAVNQIESKITPNTRAIMPVHLYGQMADMDPIIALAKKHRLVVIEDAAQAIGAEDKGRRAGSFGQYGCFSFFPSKNLGGAGDGGMVVTNDAARAEKLASLRMHGSKEKYYHKWIGGNFRLHALQAAVVTVKLRYLDQWTLARQNNASRYEALFRNSGLQILTSQEYQSDHSLNKGASCVIIPVHPLSVPSPGGDALPGVHPSPAAGRHIFNQFVIRVPRRNELKVSLKNAGIDTEIYYPLPLHLQECFRYLGYRKGDFPESERAAEDTLALPVYPELSDSQAEYVVNSIVKFLNGSTANK